jgi:ketosteroid isomerase-like protein
VSEENVDLIRRLNAVFNAGDYDAMADFFAPDAELADATPLPDAPSSGRGHEALRTMLNAWTEGFSGFEADILESIDLDPFVVCLTRWRFVSADSGIETTWTGAEAYEIREGKVVWGQAGFRDKEAAIAALRARER